MGNPIPGQERSVDPYSSYNSDVVNKLTRIVSDGNNALLMPSPLYTEISDSTNIIVRSGKALMDDVLIETQDLAIDMTDSDFYVDSSSGVWDEVGYYYVVLEYQYEKVSPAPESSLKIIKPSQRSTSYDTSKHLFINVINVSDPGTGNQVDEILGYDPDDVGVLRDLVGGGGAGTSVTFDEITTGTFDASGTTDTVIGDTTGGNIIVNLPLTNTTNRVIRIIKITTGSSIQVIASGTDTIEGQASIYLYNQYDSITIVPNSTNSVWIEV